MKIHTLLLAALFSILSLHSFASKVPGYFIKPTGERVETVFKMHVSMIKSKPGFLGLQDGIVCFKEGEKMVISPDMVKEIGFTINDSTYVMKSITDKRFKVQKLIKKTAPEGTKLIHCVVDGSMSLYHHYVIKTTGGAENISATTATEYLFQRDGGELFFPNGLKFRKEMAEYLQNCPSLVQLIKKKKFKYKHADEIVKYYNTKCK